ncbi:MAG: heme exporter protein CcmB [Planctomycetes bacterium]|nr:heme exporter protein CcmB [Planctomycetota bacterium]
MTKPPSPLASIALLVERELLAERRSWGWLASSMLLGLILVVLVGIGFFPEPAGESKTALTVVALWLGFLFAGTVGVSRNFAGERQLGAFEALLMLPLERWTIYLAKVANGLIFLLLTIAVMLLGGVVFANLRLGEELLGLFLIMLLAAIGFTAMATLIAALTSSLRGRDALLAIALFPPLIPLFLFAAGATRDLSLGSSIGEITQAMVSLLGIDALYLALGVWTFEKVVEA